MDERTVERGDGRRMLNDTEARWLADVWTDGAAPSPNRVGESAEGDAAAPSANPAGEGEEGNGAEPSCHAQVRDDIAAIVAQMAGAHAGSLEMATVARLRERYGEHARAITEWGTSLAKAAGRRPCDAKIPEAFIARRGGAASVPLWLCDTETVQQATPWLVATHRAGRLASLGVELAHDVTCAMGTEVAALQQTGILALGSDIDPARVVMAAHNCAQMQQLTGTPALIARADALAPASRAEVILADPARRAGGRRIISMDDAIPPLPDLTAAWVRRGAEMVVKCAPGVDYSTWRGEAQVVSVAGAVKETALWTPGLTQDGVTRRATLIAVDGTVSEFTDALPADLPEPGLGRYIVEPDGAIVRAGLVAHAAAAWQMRLLDPHLAFVTGENAPAGVPACEVWEKCTLKQLPAVVAEQCASRGMTASPAIEVLVRGAQVDPDVLRAKVVAGLKKKLGRAGGSPRRVAGAVGEPRAAAGVVELPHHAPGVVGLPHRAAGVVGQYPAEGVAPGGAVDTAAGNGSADVPEQGLTVVVARVGEGRGAKVVAYVCGPRKIHTQPL